MVRVFSSKIIEEQLTKDELNKLIKDFRTYKSGKGLPRIFGRDAPYDHRNTLPIIKAENVQHIHMMEHGSIVSVNTVQFYQLSDVHLVYCSSYNDESCYLLMSILAPDAHDKAKDRNTMYKLGKMAESFRNTY